MTEFCAQQIAGHLLCQPENRINAHHQLMEQNNRQPCTRAGEMLLRRPAAFPDKKRSWNTVCFLRFWQHAGGLRAQKSLVRRG